MVFDMIDAAGPGQPLAEVPQPMRIATSQPIDLTQITPMTLLQIAVERGNTPMDVLERLMTMAAKTAYADAMAKFKLDPPIILKTKRVYFEGRDGGATTDYHHATHADVTVPIIKGLAKVGITHSWVPAQKDGYVYVTCVLTHIAGHSESVEMFASPDTSGNKKGVQTIVSTKTYLERHTLLALTGLTTDDMPDDDGRDTGERKERDPADPPFDADGGRDMLREKPTTYDAAMFASNLPQWREVIGAGRKTPDELIAFIEKRNLPLTPAQKQQLRAARAA